MRSKNENVSVSTMLLVYESVQPSRDPVDIGELFQQMNRRTAAWQLKPWRADLGFCSQLPTCSFLVLPPSLLSMKICPSLPVRADRRRLLCSLAVITRSETQWVRDTDWWRMLGRLNAAAGGGCAGKHVFRREQINNVGVATDLNQCRNVMWPPHPSSDLLTHKPKRSPCRVLKDPLCWKLCF